MDWDTHFNNLTALVRAAGVGGAFSRSSSAIVSSYGALSLSAATGANISRTAKDLLTRLFGTPEEDLKRSINVRKRLLLKNNFLLERYSVVHQYHIKNQKSFFLIISFPNLKLDLKRKLH